MKKRTSMKVSILVLEDCTPMAPVSALEIFNKAGATYQEITKSPRPFFETELISIKGKRVKSTDQLGITCTSSIDVLSKTDLVVIPSIDFDIENKLQQNNKAIPHLIRLHKKGAELCSLCTGTFLLAATGLLKNRSATTHWYMAPKFQAMFPDVKLQHHKVIVDEGGIYSSGGATSSMHLAIYLTEKYCGKETANIAARMLLLDGSNVSQTKFSLFMPQTQHADEAIARAQKFIEQEQAEKLTVESVASKVHLSKRSFIRRFKSATGNTPVEYMQRMNVEKAKQQLEHGKNSIEEIIYSLGYNDIHSFRKIFARYTDLTPREYRERYGM
jgi:transcriptional regulator GlxA family with amidase domain